MSSKSKIVIPFGSFTTLADSTDLLKLDEELTSFVFLTLLMFSAYSGFISPVSCLIISSFLKTKIPYFYYNKIEEIYNVLCQFQINIINNIK